MNDSWQHYSERTTYHRFKCRSAILFFLAVSSWASAQVVHPTRQLSADQLLQYYRSLKNPSQQGILTNEFHDRKCGFAINAQIHSRWKEFTTAQQADFSKLMQARIMQSSIDIGHFKIYFDTSGSNTPALLDSYGNRIPDSWQAYMDSVGRIFNHVWDVEVGELQYAQPPLQSDSLYHVYIVNLAPGLYGETYFEPNYIQVDNDYMENGYYTHGINALKVTAAHEFHHAIQVGAYRRMDDYVHEITSTWMEDVVYNDVNDYVFWLDNYFNYFSNGLSFNSSDYSGYERCIWAHYLARRFNRNIMQDVWTRMRTQPFLESTDAALMSRGSNLKSAFAEFTYWNYYTADRADTVKYYPEGNSYPRFQPLQKTVYMNRDVTVGGDVSPLSSSMYEFDLASSDTLTAIIANVDVNAVELGQTLTQRVDVTLFSQKYPLPYHQFENELKARIVVADTSLWRSSFSQSSTLIYGLKRFSNPAPNPFHVNQDQQLILPVNEDETGLAKVYLYSSSLSLVYTAEVSVTYQSKSMVIAVSGSDLQSKLSSGVYFVIAKTRKKDYQWKVSVIR